LQNNNLTSNIKIQYKHNTNNTSTLHTCQQAIFIVKLIIVSVVSGGRGSGVTARKKKREIKEKVN
jgi:hypothetical protein